MRTVNVRGVEYEICDYAFIDLGITGEVTISLGGRIFNVTKEELERLQREEGIQPGCWCFHEPTGKMMYIPGRHE